MLCFLIEEKDKKKCHSHIVHEPTNIEVFSGTIFIKQKRLEMVDIDAKNLDASGTFCVNAYFLISSACLTITL